MPGLNLRNIANGAIQGLNPNVMATIRRSTGYTTDASGKRTPTFQDITIAVQIQPISTGDMQKLDNLNIQGVHRAIYVSAEVEAMIRVDKKGGDQIIFAPGVMPEDNDSATKWIVSAVLEVYQSGWRKVACTLQASYS